MILGKESVVRFTMTVSAVVVCGFGLASCGMVARSANAIGNKIKSSSDKLDGKYDINDDSSNKRSGRGGFNELKSMNSTKVMGELPREEDIVWAPEDPDVPIAELAGIAADDDNPVDSWFVDYKKAMQKSRKDGKPLMIWFTSTRNSPFCKALSNELLSKSEFDTWADENVVRLRIDATIKGKTDADRIEKRKYVESLKKRYKVMGHPVVLIVSPRGTEFGNYRGYKRGGADLYWGRLKNAARSAQRDYSSWKNEMESKGYRVWHNNSGKSVFAKASRYKEGNLWLIEPDGRKSMTTLNRLSLEDKLYIENKLRASRKE